MSERESIKPDYALFDRDSYGRMISTPSRDPLFFEKFIALGLLKDELLAEPRDRVVRVFDIACGHAHEFDQFARLPESFRTRVDLTGLDLSKENLETARRYFAVEHPEMYERMHFIQGDVTEPQPELEENSYDIAIGINAMAYVPGHMLHTIYRALKPGGKAMANFMVTDKNPEYTNFYCSKGMVTSERFYEIQKDLSTLAMPIMQQDHSGSELPEMAPLGRQSFFHTDEEVRRLLEFIGFQIVGHEEYGFSSMASRLNVHDVFTIQKPSPSPENERSGIYEKIISHAVGVKPVIKHVRERVGDHCDDFLGVDFSQDKKSM